MNSLIPATEPTKPAIKVGPILHLLRHAEAEHKTSSFPSIEDLQQSLKIKDPKLNNTGLEQCKEAREELESHAKYITHAICSPLSRALDAALLALSDISSKVAIIALPELQTLGNGPNGTGLVTADLKFKYDCTHRINEIKNILRVEMSPEDAFIRHVDFRFMKDDWDDETAWRVNYIKGFVSGLSAFGGLGSAVEVVAVGHGSFFRKLIGEPRESEWSAPEWRSFCLDENGELVELDDDMMAEMRSKY